jgi:ferrochelatase
LSAGSYDAVVVVSFGGPEDPGEVMPFLEKVVEGRRVPAARLQQVAAQYLTVGGVSPINAANRRLVAALGAELGRRGLDLPVYFGNRNWRPWLADEVARMAGDGVRRAVAFVTSAYSSYSGCRQYLEDIAASRRPAGPAAPAIDKLPPFYERDGWVGVWARSVAAARQRAGLTAPVIFTAHSLPLAMAAGCDYQAQLEETASRVAALAGVPPGSWQVAYQSRSGPPSQPWLEPDVNEAIAALPAGTAAVVVAPIGFLADHMEVIYDLDHMAAATAGARGVALVRAATPGTDPEFVAMVADLVGEAVTTGRLACCPPGCCPPDAVTIDS